MRCTRLFRRYLPLALLSLLSLGLFLGTASANEDPRVEQLLQAARSERGPLNIYFSMDAEVIRRLAEGFEARYGLRADFVRSPAAPLTQRFNNELRAGQVNADVFSTSTEPHFRDMADLGVWAELDENDLPALADYPSEYWHKSFGIWGAVPYVVMWNSDIISDDEIPDDWPGLLKDEWKGRIGISDLPASLSHVKWYHHMRVLYGDDFLTRLRELSVVYPSSSPLSQAVAAGEIWIGLMVWPHLALDLMSKGAPVKYRQYDNTVGSERIVAIPKDAPNPATARLFLNWLLSPEGQEIGLGNYQGMSFLPGVPTTLEKPKDYVSYNMRDILEQKDSIQSLLGL